MPVETKLRLASVLMGAVPDARALIRRRDGAAILAGRHPACDVSASQLRLLAFAVAHRCSGAAAAVGELRDVELAGALAPEGAGLYRRHTGDGREERWLATTLPPVAVTHLVEEHAERYGPGITVDVVADHDLGASALCLTAETLTTETLTTEPLAGAVPRLDHAAFALVASCLIAELHDTGS
ncbi:MAG: hypothetical protein AB7W59_18660 [Acidimicrobiia bacterium]